MHLHNLSRRGALALGAGLLASCAQSVSGRLRIGYQRYGLLLVAKTRGELEKRLAAKGVDKLEWTEFPSGPPLLEAMNAGAIDFGVTGDAPPIFAQSAGARLDYVAVQPLKGAGEAILVRAASTLRAVQDLKGRSIGYTKGSSGHMFVVQALQQAGLSLSDVKSVYLAPAEAVTAFAHGDIDAWAVWDPFFAIAERDQHARVLISRASTPASGDVLLASKDLVATRPNVVRAVLNLLRLDAAWANENPEQAARIISASSGLPLEIVLTSLRREPIALHPVTDADISAQQDRADIFARLGLIPRRIDVGQVVWRGWTGA